MCRLSCRSEPVHARTAFSTGAKTGPRVELMKLGSDEAEREQNTLSLAVFRTSERSAEMNALHRQWWHGAGWRKPAAKRSGDTLPGSVGNNWIPRNTGEGAESMRARRQETGGRAGRLAVHRLEGWDGFTSEAHSRFNPSLAVANSPVRRALAKAVVAPPHKRRDCAISDRPLRGRRRPECSKYYWVAPPRRAYTTMLLLT